MVVKIIGWVIVTQICYKNARKMLTYDSLNPIIAVKKASDIN